MILTNEQLKQHAPLGTAILLGILLFFTSLYTLAQWHHDWTLINQSIEPSQNTTQNETAQLVASLPDAHLFGQNFSESGEVPVTTLQLRVTGIVKIGTEDNETISKAYISISGQPSKIFQIGDSLPDGVKIYEITNDTVILENEGRLERLPLPRQKLEFKPRSEVTDE